MNRLQGVRTGVAGVVLLGLLGLSGACQRKPADQAPAAGTPADSARQAHLAIGQRAYLASCAMCHGPWGLGDGPLAAQLQQASGTAPAHLNDQARLTTLGRSGVVSVIEKGGSHTGRSNLMPAWGERLPSEEIEIIADFVMALPELHRAIPPSTMSKYLEAPPGATEEGRRLYVTMCVICHGPEGRGNGRYADSLFARNKIRPRDLTDSLYFVAKPDSVLFATVSLGGGYFHKSPFMPVWGATLSPEQVKDLVSYVRVLSRTGAK
jgi:mono/diheme cytochrome c family protein